ncbi:hypothetical protein HMPREF9446_02860 [Bacteroides fluxus YIT 12057]|uniref:Uncharacterized protein n=1 Tax=Bacteroides fluxus YIT 12057 TaxID=763034 RepID=F3PVT2_9BACE|nr:hypothetical protein HMPREF9446_02860 [Bacteroides fluxus YIT 12057]
MSKACEYVFKRLEYMFKHCEYVFTGFEQRLFQSRKNFSLNVKKVFS